MTVRPLSQTNDPITQRLSAVLAQLDRIVVGKREPLKLAFACLLARGHLLIEDIPGVGKSTLARALATTARSSTRSCSPTRSTARRRRRKAR